MKESLNLSRTVYGSTTYTRVVDTEFRELIPPTTPEEESIDVDQFFQFYDQLFFEIPLTGETNSHEYLVRRSSEYLGGDLLTDNEKALIDEINSLRQQLLEANKSIVDISSIT